MASGSRWWTGDEPSRHAADRHDLAQIGADICPVADDCDPIWLARDLLAPLLGSCRRVKGVDGAVAAGDVQGRTGEGID